MMNADGLSAERNTLPKVFWRRFQELYLSLKVSDGMSLEKTVSNGRSERTVQIQRYCIQIVLNVERVSFIHGHFEESPEILSNSSEYPYILTTGRLS